MNGVLGVLHIIRPVTVELNMNNRGVRSQQNGRLLKIITSAKAEVVCSGRGCVLRSACLSFNCVSVQNYCNSNQPISLKLGVKIVLSIGKNVNFCFLIWSWICIPVPSPLRSSGFWIY